MTGSSGTFRVGRFGRRALCLFLPVLAVAGCGDPQSPTFESLRISYRSVTGDWVDVDDVRDGTALGSPVRIQGLITDNTAVVAPSLTLVGERRDVGDGRADPFEGRCRGAPDSFYECDLVCAKPQDPAAAAYVCEPGLPADALIRGDRFVVSLSTDQEEFQVEVRVREATRLDYGGAGIGGESPLGQEAIRVLKLASLQGEANPFLWGLRYRSRKDAGGAWVNEEPLRYGDALEIGAGRDEWFQLLVSDRVNFQGVTWRLSAPPRVTWKSLVKWNEFSRLALNAKTGGFIRPFHLFDPRVGPGIEDAGQGAIYTFVVYARDVADQKDGTFRERREAFPLRFVPPADGIPEPELVIDELADNGAEIRETSTASHVLNGNVTSAAGEVRTLQLALSDGAGGDRRVHEVDPDSISLTGDFGVNVELVSDWGNRAGNGAIQGAAVKNVLEVVAVDTRGQARVKTYAFDFTPPVDESAPTLGLLEFFPSLGQAAQGVLPAGERVYLRAVASDKRGQPGVSSQLFRCPGDEGPGTPEINEPWCESVDPVEIPWPMDASGRFPDAPWEGVCFRPEGVATGDRAIGVLRARRASTGGEPGPFTAVGVNLVPDAAAPWYAVTVSSAVSRGPINTQIAPANAAVLDPARDLEVEVSVQANVLPVGRLVARYNGLRPGKDPLDLAPPEVTALEAGGYLLRWSVPAGSVTQGTRICLGGESVAGHLTLQLLEFVEVRDGWMAGVSVVTDEASCAP